MPGTSSGSASGIEYRYRATDTPLVSILRHSSTKVFVSHGSLRHVQASLVEGKPVLLIPSTLDHGEVARFVAKRGAGVVLRSSELGAADVAAAVNSLAGGDGAGSASAAAAVGAGLVASGGLHRAADLLETA